MYSKCGIIQAQSLNPFYYNNGTTAPIVATVKNLVAGKSYKFNVVVEDQLGQQTLYSTAPGTTEDGAPSEIPLVYILGFGIPAGALILALIIYLVVRNRKLTKELEIEMHDVPKHAVRKAVAGPPSTRQRVGGKEAQRQPYNRLLQEDEDEEIGDYAGPDDPLNVAN